MEPVDLASSMARIATELQREPTEALTVRSVVGRALEVVPSADWASLTVRGRRGKMTTLGATHEIARRADELQYSLDEGPCVDSVEDHRSYNSGSVRHDERWPRWGAQAAELGVGSLLALLVHAGEEPTCALNLYSRREHAFEDSEFDLAMLYAVHSAHALSKARLVSGLEVAVESRHVIGMAQGIVMERFGLSVEQAFNLLRRLSSTTNTRVHDVAESIVETGRIPGDRADRRSTGTSG